MQHMSPSHSRPVMFTRKSNAKLVVPCSPQTSKEELYAGAIKSKIEANYLKEENLRLQTRIQFIESKLGQQD